MQFSLSKSLADRRQEQEATLREASSQGSDFSLSDVQHQQQKEEQIQITAETVIMQQEAPTVEKVRALVKLRR
jgi:hypothetical protein